MNFFDEIKADEAKYEDLVSKVVKDALSNGADECEASIGGGHGLNVSSRDGEVENIEYTRYNGLNITIYRDHKTGSASTTDLSTDALHECVLRAVDIAEHANSDPASGVCDRDLICTEFKDFEVLYENAVDADEAVSRAVELEKTALNRKENGIRKSDGADFSSRVSSGAYANSAGFCKARSISTVSTSLCLLGEENGKMKRGYGFSTERELLKLRDKDTIVDEAVKKTLRGLGSSKVPTGKYPLIFSEGPARSLWNIVCSAISGAAVYRRTTFLADRVNTQIMPEYVNLFEDPFVKGSARSSCYDGDGVRREASYLIKDGVLSKYLLSTYTGRELGLKSNGHAGGVASLYPGFGKERTVAFDNLLDIAGEGLVITDMMGQGLNLINGNFSYGAEGYYFKDGKFVHPVDGITVAGNLKDMLMNMTYMGDDMDDRFAVHTGSILIEGMTVSGN